MGKGLGKWKAEWVKVYRSYNICQLEMISVLYV